MLFYNYITSLLLDGRTSMQMLLLKKKLDYHLSCEKIACQYGALHLKFLGMFIVNQHLLVKFLLSHSFSQTLTGSEKPLCIMSVAILNGYFGLTHENFEQNSWTVRESLLVY